MADSAELKTATTATVTVRLIRSFEYRNIKHVVFKDVSLNQTVDQFMKTVVAGAFCSYGQTSLLCPALFRL